MFILDLTSSFDGLGKDNCKTRRGTSKFWDLGDWYWMFDGIKFTVMRTSMSTKYKFIKVLKFTMRVEFSDHKLYVDITKQELLHKLLFLYGQLIEK